MQLRWHSQSMWQMGARAPSPPKAAAGVGTVGKLMQEMFSKTPSAKSPQVLLTSRAGVRQWAQQLGRAFWPEGSLAQPRPACIAAAQVRPGAWSHSFKQVVLVRGLDHIAACESPLFTSGVQQELQLRWLRQPMSQMGARAPSHPKAVVGVGTVRNLMQEMFSKISSAKSPQLLLASRAGGRQLVQLGRPWWPEGARAQPRAVCIAVAQAHLAWCLESCPLQASGARQ